MEEFATHDLKERVIYFGAFSHTTVRLYQLQRQKRINLRHQQEARTQQCFNRAKKKELRNTMAEKKRRQEKFSIRGQLANAMRKGREKDVIIKNVTQDLDKLKAKYKELQVRFHRETPQMLSHNQEEVEPWEWYFNLEWYMRYCMSREGIKNALDAGLEVWAYNILEEEMDLENEDDLIQKMFQIQVERWELRDKLKKVNEELADSKKRVWARDKELEETKAERTREEEEMKKFKQQLEGGYLECLAAKDKEVEIIKERAKQTQKEIEERAQQTQKEIELRAKQTQKEIEERAKQTQKEIENELECSICRHLFIEPVILECTHSYCTDCIRKWAGVKNQCPKCRAVIQSQTRNLVLENCIECIVKRLPPEEKKKRLKHRLRMLDAILDLNSASSSSSDSSSDSSSPSASSSSSTASENDEPRPPTPDQMELTPAMDLDSVSSSSSDSSSDSSHSSSPSASSSSSTASENDEPRPNGAVPCHGPR